MPLSACSSGLVVTALLALLLLPAQYYVPELRARQEPPAPRPVAPPAPRLERAWPAVDLVYFPALDLVFTFALLVLTVLIYLCEWIQRKLMERRMVKLNQRLRASVERLRARDAQLEQVEATLRVVQNATAEYNLLLYLLLREHRCLATPHPRTPYKCEKDVDDELHFLRNPTLET